MTLTNKELEMIIYAIGAKISAYSRAKKNFIDIKETDPKEYDKICKSYDKSIEWYYNLSERIRGYLKSQGVRLE